jgi:uncharacterized protein YbaR (Trm112 family)
VLSEEFLKIVRCPLTQSPLALADEPLLARLQQAVAEHRVKNRVGQLVERPLDGGLVNRDSTLLFPIYDNIPNLIPDEAIPLDQLDGSHQV